MRIINLASGSSGNSTLIIEKDTKILIDAGISRKRIEGHLSELGLGMEDIDAVLITHEHADHIAGLGVVLRKDFIPVYATLPTIKAMLAKKTLGKVEQSLFNPIEPYKEYAIGDVIIDPVSVYHDAAGPVAYIIKAERKSGRRAIGVLTDTGRYDERMVEAFAQVDEILIETNHDINMLQVGSYPYELKQRILGDRGHLCNEMGARFVGDILSGGLRGVLLGHLSKENNYPPLAMASFKNELVMRYGEEVYNRLEVRLTKEDGITELREI
jgi:phosphoribosyl 1,2-cyclic phosphodiesterase